MFHPKNLCTVCGKITHHPFEPCMECVASMRLTHSTSCILCSFDLAGADNPCPDCRSKENLQLDGLIALGSWSGMLREWVSILKFGGDIRLSTWLSNQLISLWINHWPGRPVIPVPPRRGKILREGFDLVDTLAAQMSSKGVPIMRVLRRLDTQSQKKLNRKDRISGVRLRIEAKAGLKVSGDCIVLDDVTTTGSTLEKCAAVLKHIGAQRVYGLVLCRD